MGGKRIGRGAHRWIIVVFVSVFSYSESAIESLPEDLATVVSRAFEAETGSSLKLNDSCNEEDAIVCPPSKFRDPSGLCNNVRHPRWGNRAAPFLRLLPPSYADGVSQPRTSSPSSLEVVSALQNVPSSPHESVTALLGAWAELVYHDLVETASSNNENCCSKGSGDRECFGTARGRKCKGYARSLPALGADQCEFKHRDQMNLASAFLDGSAVYGNTIEQMSNLRTYDAGLVNVSACAECSSNALYSAVLREHNRVAIDLAKLNHHWSDELVFLESRRIVIAELQHITYAEFLPIVLGEESVVNSELELKSYGRFSKYSSARKAGVFNSVAVTALPALLSLLPNSLKDESPKSFAEMIDLLISTPARTPSLHILPTLRKNWDSSILLVNMGRDHGIATYTNWLQYCSNATFATDPTFDYLEGLGMKKEYIKILKELYDSSDHIDLIVGALLEKAVPGAIVGPTFNCLLSQQFTILKESDRFWYENDLPPSSLTTQQLKEIKKSTLAGLLCANTDGLNYIQPKAFIREDDFLNARISCNQHPLPQLKEWTEVDHMADMSEEMLMSALSKAEQEVLERRKMEYQVWSQIGGADPKSPVGMAASFSSANKNALKIANTSLLFELASNEIVNSVLKERRRKRQIIDNQVFPSVFRGEISEDLQHVDIASLIPPEILEEHIHCDDTGPCDPHAPFRTYTGHCNNLRNPNLGKSLTTFSRLLPSAYHDGISKPRIKGVTGLTLPNPRLVSRVIHPDISNLHKKYNLMVMQYAQFLDHDLQMTPIHKGFHESIPNCRPCDSPRTVHPECNPYPVPPDDPYYPEVNVTSGDRLCFPFMRSLPGQRRLGPREQVNQNTAFLDASQIYGENLCVVNKLKGLDGRMNVTYHPQKTKDLLPRTDSHPECKSPSGLCFIAGDGRASEQPGITAIHTIFMREHNRISDGLRRINPHWDHEKLFENTRKIVVAQNQHLTYNEFLPRILGWNAMNLYGLKLQPQGYYKEYDPTCNPAVVTEFAAAAFRIGHSLLRPHIPRMNSAYQIVDPPILLRDGFFKTDFMMQAGMIDEITRGLVSTPMETLDQFITGEVTNHLFEDRKVPFSGIDLISLNVQRARDHGIPSYNNYRALCNLKRATSFDDLAREIPHDIIQRFKRIYASVDDIDLFPGGMSERPLQGGIVGPTFACIIAIQFRQLRKCDRFWYENDGPAVRFTEPQLAEMRKTTLAKIICDNMDGDVYMQRAAFDLPSNFLNPRVPCRSMPAIDLSAWREGAAGGGCTIAGRRVRVGESAFPSPCTSCVCTDEGPNCASLRVTDCDRLLQEWSRDAILRDEVCTAQCGFHVRNGAPSGFSSPARSVRSRFISFEQPSFGQFGGFKFPDLSPYISK